MKRALTTTNPAQIANLNDVMKQAGKAANQEAARRIFADHTARKASNTIRRKMADLALFEVFLQEAGVPAAGLYEEARAWRGVTWGACRSVQSMAAAARLCHRLDQRTPFDGPNLCPARRENRRHHRRGIDPDRECRRLRPQRSKAHR